MLQLLLFGALAFTLLILSGYYPTEMRAVNLDTDWFYRKGVKYGLPMLYFIFGGFASIMGKIFTQLLPNKLGSFVRKPWPEAFPSLPSAGMFVMITTIFVSVLFIVFVLL